MIRTLCLGLSFVVLAGAATAQNSILSGLTIRVIGGLDRLAGLDELNDSIADMNYYYGPDGSWVMDIAGAQNTGGWGSILQVGKLHNRSDAGIGLEYDILKRDFSSITMGVEYTGGVSSKSNYWSYVVPTTGQDGAIAYSEHIEVTNIMGNVRYNLRDLNLPISIHVGAGVGSSTITQDAEFYLLGDTPVLDGTEEIKQLTVNSDGEESILSGRLFTGVEYQLGPLGFKLDLGYNFMDFGTIESDTEFNMWNFNPVDGAYVPVQVANSPENRYGFQPALESVNQMFRRFNLTQDATVFMDPLELQDDAEFQEINYDLSGGYVRFSVGYHF